LYTPLLSPYVLHVPLISFFSIWSSERYWVRERVNRLINGRYVVSACEYVIVKYDAFVTVFDYTLRGKDIWWSGGVTSRILKLGIVWRWVVSLTSGRFTSGAEPPVTHRIGGWVCSRACLDAVKKYNSFVPTGNLTSFPWSFSP
jgi:hypothetical protein